MVEIVGKRELGRESVGGMILLKYFLKKYDAMPWTGFIWLWKALVNTAMNILAP